MDKLERQPTIACTWLALIFVSIPAAATDSPAQTDDKVIVRTTILDSGPSSPGVSTPTIVEVVKAIEAKDFDAARATLKPVIDRCETAEKTSKERLLSFTDAGEFIAFSAIEIAKSNHGSTGKGLLWLRDDCAVAYKESAYLYVEANDANNAFRYLDLASNRAPYYAEVYAERGFLLMKTGNPQAAVDSYKKAIELADRFKSSVYVKPLALRGLGFVYTEMGKLDEAQHAYEDSLKLEPSNELAQNELKYIDGLRQTQHK